jgi:hypothetical protein
MLQILGLTIFGHETRGKDSFSDNGRGLQHNLPLNWVEERLIQDSLMIHQDPQSKVVSSFD